ncbi:MAG: Calx-beta domain-containing protein [Thiolinea sp.]
MKKIPLACLGGWLVLVFASPSQSAQIVTPAVTQRFIAAQENVDLVGVYNVSAPHTATETGLGLRVHYNSSLLTPHLDNIQLYPQHAQPLGSIQADSEDFDQDPLTDQYFIAAWIDFDAQWPGSGQLPLDLLQAPLTAQPGFNGVTRIRFSTSGTARNGSFESSPLTLCAKPEISVSSSPQTLQENAGENWTVEVQSTVPILTGCGPLTLAYELGGSATRDSDYRLNTTTTLTLAEGQSSTSLTFNLLDDDLVENDETVIFELLPGSDYTTTSNSSASLTIQSEDQLLPLPEVNLATARTSVTEASSGSVLLFVTRSTDYGFTEPLDVQLQLGGDATPDLDYQAIPTTLTIPAGQEQVFTVLVLRDDGENETTETLDISIAPDTRYRRGSQSSLQLTISDDEFNQTTQLPTTPPASTLTLNSRSIPTLSVWMQLLTGWLLMGLAGWRLYRPPQEQRS